MAAKDIDAGDQNPNSKESEFQFPPYAVAFNQLQDLVRTQTSLATRLKYTVSFFILQHFLFKLPPHFKKIGLGLTLIFEAIFAAFLSAYRSIYGFLRQLSSRADK